MDYRQAIEENTSQPEELEALYGLVVILALPWLF
jgi:hypothetical protein